MAKDNENNKQEEVTQTLRSGVARTLGKQWQSVFDKFNDTPKKDLSYAQLKEICMHDEKLKPTFVSLITEDKVNATVSVAKQPKDVIKAFEKVIKIEIDPNDPTAVQEGIAGKWLAWWNQNNPSKTKEKATPKSVTIGNIVDYTLGEGISFDPTSVKAKSLKSRLSTLDLEKTKVVDALFVKKAS